MTYIQWVHAEPLQLVQGTEQVLPTAMIRYVVVVLARTVWTALGLVYVSGTACDGMRSVDSLGRVVRPRSASKSRRLWSQTPDFTSEDVPSGQGFPKVYGCANLLTLIRFWRDRNSTGLSASLLVRLGIATSASLTGSMLVVTDDLHPMGTYRTLFQLVPNLIPVGSG
jgi:hypothetical protein